MRRAALGDREAIAALYDRYAATLLGVALRILGVHADAQDAVHDVFVSLPARARHYTAERGSVMAWLVILARNTSIDRLRRQRRAAHVASSAEAAAFEGANQRDPESEAVSGSSRESVRAALAALPQAQRTALEAAFFEGLTYSQIAEREGVPLGTIKARCARAIVALREALEKGRGGPGEE